MINLLKRRALHPVTKEEIFYPAWVKNQDTDSVELAELMAQAGGMSAGMASASLLDFPKFIIAELLKGNQVNIRGLGSFKLKVNGKAKKTREEVSSSGLKDTLEIVFVPEYDITAAVRAKAKFRFVTKTANSEDEITDASAGTDYETDEPIDSSTGTIDVSTNTADASTNTVDSSTGTIDPSTNGGGSNDGMD